MPLVGIYFTAAVISKNQDKSLDQGLGPSSSIHEGPGSSGAQVLRPSPVIPALRRHRHEEDARPALEVNLCFVRPCLRMKEGGEKRKEKEGAGRNHENREKSRKIGCCVSTGNRVTLGGKGESRKIQIAQGPSFCLLGTEEALPPAALDFGTASVGHTWYLGNHP